MFGQFPKALRHTFKHMWRNLDRGISDPKKLEIQGERKGGITTNIGPTRGDCAAFFLSCYPKLRGFAPLFGFAAESQVIRK